MTRNSAVETAGEGSITAYVRRPLVRFEEEGEVPDLKKPFKISVSARGQHDVANAIGRSGRDLLPARCPAVVERQIGDETVLFPHQSNVAFALDSSSATVWRLCDGSRSADEILAELSAGRDTEAAQAGARRALAELYELRVLRFRGENPAGLGETRWIDLRELRFYVINLRDDTKKADFMRQQLDQRGLRHELVPAVKSKPRRIGTALAHLKALQREGLRPPFCIIEDDCSFTDAFRYRFELPAATDALYLGVSRFGTRDPGQLSWGAWNHTKYMRFSADYLRPFNMLARHAVVFLSDRYQQNAIAGTLDALTYPETPLPGDVAYARLQTTHLVLTPNDPLCYQSEHHGGNHPATRRPLHDLAV